MRFWLTIIAVAISLAGCAPADPGTDVSIPSVALQCATSHCRTNVSSPYIYVVYTTSPCSDPLFGGSVSSSTRAISCNGSSGCNGTMSSWVNPVGSTSSIPSGTYNICACINYSGPGDWSSCNTVGEIDDVSVSSSTGSQIITHWTDQ